MKVVPVIVAIATSWLVCACGDDDVGATEPDGGGAPDAGADPWQTEPPVAPVFTPCPEGWREVVSPSGVTTCDPWPEGGRADCSSPYEAHFPGEPGCAPIGNPCPAGEYSDAIPAGARVLYVRPGAIGGNGTIDQPFDTIARALAIATPGTVIALAKGRFEEVVVITQSDVVIQGACVAETTLTYPTGMGVDPVLRIAAPGVVVRDLRIAESPRVGVFAEGSGEATLEGVLVNDVTTVAIAAAYGGTITARTLVARDVVGNSTYRVGGYAISIELDGTVDVQRAVFERTTQIAAGAAGADAILRLTDVAIHDTRSNVWTGDQGTGILTVMFARLEALRVVVQESRDHGVLIGTDCTASVDWLIVSDTRGLAGRESTGRALGVQAGANVTASHVLLERNARIGLNLNQSTLHAEDVVVRDQEGGDAGDDGRGVNLYMATMTGARMLVENVREVGFVADATTLDLTDLTVRDILPRRFDSEYGVGIAVIFGAQARITRASVDRASAIGVGVDLPGTFGRFEQLVVRDTREHVPSGRYGRALAAQVGSTLEVAGGLFEDSREAGVFVHSATARLDHVAIRRVVPRACAADTCVDEGLGSGVIVMQQGHAELSDFVIADTALCGVQLAFEGALDLHRGEISRSEIGACVQVDPYDVSRLSDMVAYRDLRAATIDATSLPVPDVAATVGQRP